MLYKIVTYKDLKWWNILSSDLCTFCNLRQENVLHLLYECELVTTFWSQVELDVNQKCPLEDTMDWSHNNIIMNTVHPKPQHIVNTIVSIAKQYLYQCQCLKNPISTHTLVNMINKIHRYELYYAKIKNFQSCTRL